MCFSAKVPFFATLLLALCAPDLNANLLTNGDLELPGTDSETATGWTIDEGPAPANAMQFVSFANHTPGGNRGAWLRSFEGGLDMDAPPLVFAHLYQDLAAIPGAVYDLTAWSRWEMFYPGGVDMLSTGAPSPTDTFLALEFFDAGASLLSSAVLDLRTVQANDNMWRQFAVQALAPASAATVRVRASMEDGLLNPMANPQSAFWDDFELTTTAIPEPSTWSLTLLGAAALLAAHLLGKWRRLHGRP